MVANGHDNTNRMRNLDYDLTPYEINEDSFLILGEYVATGKGIIYGAKILKYKNQGYRPYFVHKRKAYSVAKVILTLFNPRPRGIHIRHIDGNVDNCAIDNLEWGNGADMSNDNLLHIIDHHGSTLHSVKTFAGIYLDYNGNAFSVRNKTRSVRPLKIRKLDGHPSITFKNHLTNKSQTMYIHQGMMEAFNDIPYGKFKCIWKDGDRANNRPSNLQKASTSEVIINHFKEGKRDPEMFQAFMDEMYGKGERPWLYEPRAPLTRSHIMLIRRLKKNSPHALAEKFSVDYQTILNIQAGRTYKKV